MKIEPKIGDIGWVECNGHDITLIEEVKVVKINIHYQTMTILPTKSKRTRDIYIEYFYPDKKILISKKMEYLAASIAHHQDAIDRLVNSLNGDQKSLASIRKNYLSWQGILP